jgi:hypothetical protein
LVEVTGGETAEVTLALLDTSNTGEVEGLVADPKSGSPIPGARIEVEGTGLAVASDSLGHYAIEQVPAGMHKLIVTSSGRRKAYTVVRVVKDWAVTANLYLREQVPGPDSGR